MSTAAAMTTIGPDAYRLWRGSSLGRVTEAIEQRLVLELMNGLAGAGVLDVGCGDGLLACTAALRGAAATGLDPDPSMLDAARARAACLGASVDFIEGRVERLPFPDASFDVVTAVTVLCFVDDAAQAVREMARVLRPGGRLVLGELGRHSLWAAIRRLRGWFGAPIWKRARFWTAAELRVLAHRAGLRVAMRRAAVFYPPLGASARFLAPLDPWLGRRTTLGAAFIALRAHKEAAP